MKFCVQVSEVLLFCSFFLPNFGLVNNYVDKDAGSRSRNSKQMLVIIQRRRKEKSG